MPIMACAATIVESATATCGIVQREWLALLMPWSAVNRSLSALGSWSLANLECLTRKQPGDGVTDLVRRR
jgi:hypothetical protein